MAKHRTAFLSQPNDDFDWTLYEDGYNGKTRHQNGIIEPWVEKLSGKNNKIKVFSHEPYALDLLAKYMGTYMPTTSKDEIRKTAVEVVDVKASAKGANIIVETAGGGSALIDLNKERDYISTFGYTDPWEFINALHDKDFVRKFIESRPVVKEVENSRVSLTEGRKAIVEQELREQIVKNDIVYQGKFVAINNGGYVVDILGVKCWCPGSLAQANRIRDYEALIGKTVPVMVENWNPVSGFVVSHKKFLNLVLPKKIDEELYPGMEVDCEVTDTRNGNVFMQFPSVEPGIMFTALLPYDIVSDSTKKDIDYHQFRAGGKWREYIYDITTDDKGRRRIVLVDEPGRTKESDMLKEAEAGKENTDE